MIFLSLGVAGRFAEWCDGVTARLMQRMLGPTETASAETLEEFATAAIGVRARHLLVASRQLFGQLPQLLAETQAPFVVALDEPRVALEQLVVLHGLDPLEATRIAARSWGSLMSCASAPGALVLRGEEAAASPIAAAKAIARHHGLGGGGDGAADAIVAELAGLGLSPRLPSDGRWWSGLDGTMRATADGALAPYAQALAGGGLGPITWERDLFFLNEDRPDGEHQPASRPVDLTGRARCVLCGPYIALPPGSWSASVVLGFSEEAMEMSFLVEIYADAQVAQIAVQPDGQRSLEANLNFTIAQPALVEIRISSERPAFEGRLALGHVTLLPAGALRPETHRYFTSVLA